MKDMNALVSAIKFRLNIEQPCHEENYSFGYECALAGVLEEDNPYDSGSAAYEQWLEGWWAGFYGEEPLFELINPQQTASHLALNEEQAASDYMPIITNVLALAGVITATAVLGYQIFEMVA